MQISDIVKSSRRIRSAADLAATPCRLCDRKTRRKSSPCAPRRSSDGGPVGFPNRAGVLHGRSRAVSFVARIVEIGPPELTSAKVIISGGRACSRAENFAKYINRWPTSLARRSRLARRGRCRLRADDWQVGQTGSGGTRHSILRSAFPARSASRWHEGFQGLVAINKDEEAPIFSDR